MHPSFLKYRVLEEKRGRRECRVLSCTRSLVCNVRTHTSVFTTGQPQHRHSLRDGVNAYVRALPGVHDLLVTVAFRSSPEGLAPAQGRQDHTISPSAFMPLVARHKLGPSHPAPRS